MIDLLVEYRHWLAGTVMGVGFVGLFIRQGKRSFEDVTPEDKQGDKA